MEDIFKQLKKAQELRMTDTERAAIRNNLMNISSGSFTASPQATQISPYVSSFGMMGLFTKAAMFALVGFIVGGTSLSFASLQALPGDTLYSVKTNVTEKIAGTFTFSTESKTRLDAQHVATRITEIKTVRENGSINDARVAFETEASFNTTFTAYTESLAKLRDEGRAARSQEIAAKTLASIKTIAPQAPEKTATLTMKTALFMETESKAIESVHATEPTGLDTLLLKAVEQMELLTTSVEKNNTEIPQVEFETSKQETETPEKETHQDNEVSGTSIKTENSAVIQVGAPDTEKIPVTQTRKEPIR